MTDSETPKSTEYLILEMRLWPSEEEKIQTWTPLSISLGKSKDEAIDALVGGREGTFKAISTKAWRGGKTTQGVSRVESEPWRDEL